MDKADLIKDWREAGIQEGDVVLLHSSIRRTLARFLKQGVRIDVQDILDSFLAAVGEAGTLVLPLFNFDFTSGIAFDMRSSPSQMGVLTEAGRLHPSAARTGHPIYSFAAIGKRADAFRDVNNFSGYGSDSPFAIVRALNGKIAVLNLPDQESMTFYHYVEETNAVPYRYHKMFTGEYTDLAGKTEVRTYGLFVRDLKKGVLTHVNPTGELMWQAGLYKGFRPDVGCGLRVVGARAMFDFVSEIIASGKAKSLLYRIEGETDG